MTTQTYYRTGATVVIIAAMLTVPVLLVGSAFTRMAFVVALLPACALIYRHGRTRRGENQ